MHLMIPHASALGEACAHVLKDLPLPHLSELLGRLQAEPALGDGEGHGEYSLNTPQELALARLRGCTAEPGRLPTAAWLLGDTAGELAWARLTPLHLSVGSDQITALGPEALQLDEAESRAFFASLAELWPAAEGWQSRWLAPDCWLLAHERFADAASASLDRVLGRPVDAWMPEARGLRTLQNEVQMLLHGQALNEAREARGALALNSVWISGCGRAGPGEQALPTDLRIDERLRAPLLAGDWAAWAEAWAALDAGPLAELLRRARAGEPLRLSLCGERQSRSYGPRPAGGLRALWQRLSPPRADTARALEAL